MAMEELTIRINTTYSRLRIHRQTLMAIGSPKFIRLGYEPSSKSLMVLGLMADDSDGIRVHFDLGGSFYFRSKGLIDGIRTVGHVLENQGSYLIKGKLSDKEPAVLFPLQEAVLVTDPDHDTA